MLTAHVVVGLLVVGWVTQSHPIVPEPVVLVELPPETSPLPLPAAASPQQPVQPREQILEPMSLPVEAPRIDAPVPPDAVTLPPSAIAPVRQVAPAPAVVAPAPQPRVAESSQASAGSDDPRAKKKAADYYAQLMAHLNRKKSYPSEAKKARQQGVVTVRFTVARSGAVTEAAIKRSSGFDVLDRATLDLMGRVSPLPPIPNEMNRDSVTISLPISYALNAK
ncbi:MAG: energy transducer TonB [Novosphingobium sp.]|nr:energy transducer TonB [Novosphingobium sp.]